MKKILVLALALLAGTYIPGAVAFSESGARRFLNELEELSMQGKSAEYCARLHADLRVSISDRSADPPAEFDGGKQQFCDYVSYAMKGVDLLGVSTHVQREGLTVRRSWLHPWTAEVSYTESRSTQMSKVNVTLRTRGEDRWMLVQTLDGVKALRLTSRTRLAQ